MTRLLWGLLTLPLLAQELPANRWVELKRDMDGARRGSAVRYAPPEGRFLLWGFHNSDPDLLQEHPLIVVPEYDMVAFDPAESRWTAHMPERFAREWSVRKLSYVPRTYSGITTGSERTVMRVNTGDSPAVPRPDLNIVFDQVAWRPADNSLYYFTGGLTAAYDVARRRWRDLAPPASPPPVLGGSLAHDAVHDEIVLFGGGHVAERGPDGSVRGYTGTWVYSPRSNAWRELKLNIQPPPRMNTRLVTDTRNRLLVLFGGDAQRRYLADTWILDIQTMRWRESKALSGPPPRAGHFTVYDPESGLVIIGGGYNREDLNDMWGYDAAADRWTRLRGEVPAGFYLSADIAPEKRLIVLVTSTRKPGDRTSCNVLFPVRTTYGYRIDAASVRVAGDAGSRQAPMPKRDPVQPQPRKPAVDNLPLDRWVELADPGWTAPARTWGSATFDSARGRILYWGGGHCGYEGSDVDSYDVATHTWIPEPGDPSYPERLWNHGVRLAGVTFDGEPWTDHGRRVYAYDPAGDRLVIARGLRLTSGYEPQWLKPYPSRSVAAPDALITSPSSYSKYVTWTWQPGKGRWSVLGPAPAGLDTLVTTPLGVMGVPVNWPARLNDAGYQLPWDSKSPKVDNPVYLLRGSRWERLDKGGPSPQNLYEMTSLAFDTKRSQLVLHGAGPRRDELWTFAMDTGQWTNRQPKIRTGDRPPACTREAVYVPALDAVLIYGGELWSYSPEQNTWTKLDISGPPGGAGQNRAMAYDAKRNVVFLVLGRGGNEGKASVFALRPGRGLGAR